ncbi:MULTISPECIES: DNA repair protein [unclassified Adlercreutzia]|uniref:Y-family DNA polymerase n=1 Tax=unclassified Adlercreutzia TaxID=2636013 RepID=UPI001F149BB6|nr:MULTISPECIES: DNA repair protein [unclassified Adlercreutzia]
MPADDGAREAERTYVCIDLKSFYASVECVARGLDPMTTRLVVADPERSQTTICLAITPAMKALGIRNRCRLFEIPEGVQFEVAKPHMRRYMEVSAEIYRVYLRYVSPQDIHAYSIDECFIDATAYLSLYGVDARGFANLLMGAAMAETGIPATAGVGPNLFLAKLALDITAKHAPDRIGFLDEASFREAIWRHRPITDIWNIGPGIARRLAKYRVFDLFGVTRMDVDVLYQEFGANAEYLIDHAWGVEPCTIAEIKAYEPESTSLGNGQVLPCDYTFEEGRMVLHEMVDATVLELVEKGVVTNHVSLAVGYAKGSGGHANASRKLPERTNSQVKLMAYLDALYDEIVDPAKMVKRVNLAFGGLVPEELATYNLFSDVEAEAEERRRQEAILAVKRKFGKNALFKGVSLREKATGRERNEMVGGHHG